jgi:acetoacetyl-CoA synthetase
LHGGTDRGALQPSRTHSLPVLRTIACTGSPLSTEGFRWIYESVKKDIWLIALPATANIASSFVGGCPLVPVYADESQRRLLGCKLDVVNEAGQAVRGEPGELVIRELMPSMPLYFWNDRGDDRYQSRYFEFLPNVWRPGILAEITEHNGISYHGRSDTTVSLKGVLVGVVGKVLECVKV